MGRTRTERSVHAPLEYVYQVVADIESYPQFVPACTGSTIISRTQTDATEQVDAQLAISFGPIRKTFATRNVNTPNSSIQITLLSGPIRELEGLWLFQSIEKDTTLVSCDIAFHVGSGALNRIVEKALKGFASQLSDAFISRARTCYLQDGAH